MSFRVLESQRDSSTQPRVGESASLPWDMRFIFPQPQRGCINSATERCNPVGVDDSLRRFPRVARASQPWAELRYPVGVMPAAHESTSS